MKKILILLFFLVPAIISAQSWTAARFAQSKKMVMVSGDSAANMHYIVNASDIGDAAIPTATSQGTKSVTSSAAAITTTASSKYVTVWNNSTTTTVYIGNASVTSSNGYPLKPGKGRTYVLDDPAKLYAVTASGTVTIGFDYQ